MEVIEQYLNSKTGDLATCEDAIFVNEHFAAVIDGVTSKSERRWDGLTTGQVAAQLVLETLPGLDPAITALDAFATINQAFRDLYEKVGRITELEKDPVERCAACVLIYSRQHHQVWSVGDSQALVDGRMSGRFISKRNYCLARVSRNCRKMTPGANLLTRLLNGTASFRTTRTTRIMSRG